MFGHLDRIAACDSGRTDYRRVTADGQTSCHCIVRAMHIRDAVKMSVIKVLLVEIGGVQKICKEFR